MQKNTIIIFLFLFVFNAFAQNKIKIDSLIQALKTNTSEKEKVDTYNLLARQYSNNDSVQTFYYANQAVKIAKKINYHKGILKSYSEIAWVTMILGNPEKAINLNQKSISIAKKTKHLSSEARAYNQIGTANNYLGNSVQALEFYFKALKIYKQLKDKLMISGCYHNIAITYRDLSNYDKALEYHYENLKIQEDLNDINEISSTYSDIGGIYSENGNYDKALEYQFKALRIQEQLKDDTMLTHIFHNIAGAYCYQEKYIEALNYGFKSIEIAKKIGWEDVMGTLYNTIGVIYKQQNDFDNALEYHVKSLETSKIREQDLVAANYINIGEIYLFKQNHKKALEYLQQGLLISKKIKNISQEATTLNIIGEVYWELGNHQQAKEYLTKGIQYAKEINYPSAIRNGSEILAKVQKSLGNHKAALESYELYHATYDSLLGQEKTKQISQLQIQYETEKKEQEIKNLAQQASIQRLELKQANFNKTIFAIVSIVLVLVGLVLYLINRQKRLALKQRAQDIEQNLLRVQMNPHFIFNAMTSIQDYMNQGNAKQAGIYLVKFSKLIRQVLDNSRSEFINLDQEINMLDNYLSIQNLKREHPFDFEIKVDENIITEEIAIPPMFAQPFIENAIEHGIVNIEKDAMITISFSLKEQNHLELKIFDNGSGIKNVMPAKQKDHTSHATKITKERIDLYRKMQKKHIAFDIQNLSKGTQVTFNLPYQYV